MDTGGEGEGGMNQESSTDISILLLLLLLLSRFSHVRLCATPQTAAHQAEKSHGHRSLVGYSPKGHKESDMIEQLSTKLHT